MGSVLSVQKHPLISNRYSYTPQEINAFLKHCHKLKLDVVPLQQCFGHVEYILRHDRYAHLREDNKDICQICPLKLEASAELFSELAETHPSQYFHIGCDEAYLLGKCRECSAKASHQGKSRLFVDYVKVMCDIVKKIGKRPVLWADMLLAHPEAADALPKDAVLIDWNYGWGNNKFGDPAPLLKTGLEFWGAPALRSHPDDHFLVCFEKHLRNLSDFLPYCRSIGYNGIVLTSWSTSGIYGFEWGTNYEPIEMHPIRRVFPLKGCRILMEGYGLKDADAKRFREALFSDSSTILEGKASCNLSIDKVLRSVRKAQTTLKKLKPVKNLEEFDLIRLYFEIRTHYLEFKAIEASTQQAAFNDKGRVKTVTTLKRMLKQADTLDKVFSKAMKGYLYSSEIETENRIRRRKMELLQERVGRIR